MGRLGAMPLYANVPRRWPAAIASSLISHTRASPPACRSRGGLKKQKPGLRCLRITHISPEAEPRRGREASRRNQGGGLRHRRRPGDIRREASRPRRGPSDRGTLNRRRSSFPPPRQNSSHPMVTAHKKNGPPERAVLPEDHTGRPRSIRGQIGRCPCVDPDTPAPSAR